jgi:hypothetical protein
MREEVSGPGAEDGALVACFGIADGGWCGCGQIAEIAVRCWIVDLWVKLAM